jgi:triosephosphate isomerase
MRKRIVAGNWKMNLTLEEGQKLTSEITNMVNDELNEEITVVINPPFPHMQAVKKLIDGSKSIFLGAQNCSDKASGAFTGEVSAAILASFGASYVIIGHSERREYFNETNEQLTEKVKLALSNNLTPIFCCGEPLEIREAGTHGAYVTEQLTKALFGFTAEEIQRLVLAYEPIWAIGTGRTASSDQAQEMHFAIRNHFAAKYGDSLAAGLSILYGGSCKPDNAQDLFSKPDVDGGLIGGASLKSRDFVDIIKSF